MVRVKGPLFSLKASKSIGKILTFQGRPKGTSCYRKPTPADPRTASQLLMRQYMGDARTAWKALSQANKDAWNSFII